MIEEMKFKTTIKYNFSHIVQLKNYFPQQDATLINIFGEFYKNHQKVIFQNPGKLEMVLSSLGFIWISRSTKTA